MPPAVPRCDDGAMNGAETDVDCGGPACAPCAVGQTCASDADCMTAACISGVCSLVPTVDAGSSVSPDAGSASSDGGAAPTCADNVTNGAETDVDCGGAECSACMLGYLCNEGADCMSGRCSGGRCAVSQCADGIKNGDETDVDCGGSCRRCPNGHSCLAFSDCASTSVCVGQVCTLVRCVDGVKNGDEVCRDCGGSCGPCTGFCWSF
jgi:hypothetical protein